MTSEQIVAVGKALLPYLRQDMRPEELGIAAHDALAALHPEAVRFRSALEKIASRFPCATADDMARVAQEALGG